MMVDKLCSTQSRDFILDFLVEIQQMVYMNFAKWSKTAGTFFFLRAKFKKNKTYKTVN